MTNIRYILIGIILVGLLIGGVLFLKKNRPAGALSAPRAAELKAKGPAGAPVQMVEYSDFQCPACRTAEAAVKKILADPEYAGKIHFVFRHFPLSSHRWSGLAHQAAECAHQSGRFWEYHDKLYAEQAGWSRLDNPMETFLRYAGELNLPLDSFGICLANPEVRHRINEERKMGDNLQINSTPTFFINGERLVGPVELEAKGNEKIRQILGLPAPPSPQIASSLPPAAPRNDASVPNS